ncbi:MAG TPA: Smr/MutS family protein [Bacteroidales bacterium]|nr:Smr/MutS family protein [Bacteroidales bacterium]
MTYPGNFEQKTGFDRIRILLKEKCLSELGRSLVDEVRFSVSLGFIEQELGLVEEMRGIVLFGQGFPAQDYFDLRGELQQMRAVGRWMDEEQLAELRSVLRTIHGILEFLLPGGDTPYPGLSREAAQISFPENILPAIDRVLDEHGLIRDDASPRLKEIRVQRTRLQARVEGEVGRMMQLARRSGWVPEDTDITVRNGRLVIPVYATAKRKLEGLVHDRSATGQTLYIEPREIFEANNELQELEMEEKDEIRRILLALADLLRPDIPSLLEAFAFLARIDFLRAKARLALDLNAHKPLLREGPHLEWFDALHPLLYLSHKAQGKTVVPLKVRLDAAQRILLISGPNAGGKSVALKTIGLLQYMLQCGLCVPLRPTSEAGVFRQLLLDIGDEQSIENDLSTYSSHLMHMKHFLEVSDRDTLFLIDEFGSGTEPRFGGALAEAILEGLYERGAYGVVTTHYANLKTLPERCLGMVNAAMQFDLANMEPLFLLETGRPGSSFAYEIASRIGLPADILQQAGKKAGEDLLALDRQLQQLANDQRALEQQQVRFRVADDFLSEMIEKYERMQKELEARRTSVLASAREEARTILSRSNQLIENTIREIREGQAEKERTRSARENLEKEKARMLQESAPPATDTGASKAIIAGHGERPAEHLDKSRRKGPPQQGNAAGTAKPRKEGFSAGDTVQMQGQDALGEVTAVKGNVAEVVFGSMKLRLPVDKLQHARENPKRGNVRRHDLRHILNELNDKMAKFSPQLDLRGKRAEEALHELQQYIDDALLLSVPDVRILHGKGDGILRQVVRDYLGTVKEVRRFADEIVELGGHGVTTVSFRSRPDSE